MRLKKKISALCGPFLMLVFLIGWPSAHLIPPLARILAADQVTAHYHNRIPALTATGLMTLGIFPFLFWLTISSEMARTGDVPELAIYAQFLGGIYTTLFMTLPAYSMAITAYWLGRSQERTQLMNDISLFLLIMNFPGFGVMAWSYSVLLDRRPRTLSPRWLAYVNTSLAILYWPAFWLVWVKIGVIEWNGSWSFWVAIAATALNIFLISFYLYKAIATKDDLPGEEENLGLTEVSNSG